MNCRPHHLDRKDTPKGPKSQNVTNPLFCSQQIIILQLINLCQNNLWSFVPNFTKLAHVLESFRQTCVIREQICKQTNYTKKVRGKRFKTYSLILSIIFVHNLKQSRTYRHQGEKFNKLGLFYSPHGRRRQIR